MLLQPAGRRSGDERGDDESDEEQTPAAAPTSSAAAGWAEMGPGGRGSASAASARVTIRKTTPGQQRALPGRPPAPPRRHQVLHAQSGTRRGRTRGANSGGTAIRTVPSHRRDRHVPGVTQHCPADPCRSAPTPSTTSPAPSAPGSTRVRSSSKPSWHLDADRPDAATTVRQRLTRPDPRPLSSTNRSRRWPISTRSPGVSEASLTQPAVHAHTVAALQVAAPDSPKAVRLNSAWRRDSRGSAVG